MSVLVIKVSAAAVRTKQAAASSAGDLQKSVQQEHARASRLEQDLAAARRDVETKTVLMMKASAAAARAKRAAENSSSDIKVRIAAAVRGRPPSNLASGRSRPSRRSPRVHPAVRREGRPVQNFPDRALIPSRFGYFQPGRHIGGGVGGAMG